MTKTIAFIDNFDEVELFLKTFEFCIDKDTVVIAGDAMAYEELKKKDIKSKPLDFYRNVKEYNEVEEYAMNLSGKWFVDNEGNDFTMYEDISLGASLQMEIFLNFNYIMRAILDVSNILKSESPEKILLLRDGPVFNSAYEGFDLFLHKKAFLFLMNNRKSEVVYKEAKVCETSYRLNKFIKLFRFERYELFAGEISFFCPEIIIKNIKKIVVFTLDRTKMFFVGNESNSFSVRALTLSATDITYFGTALVKSFLKKGNSCLFYIDGENNCYFNRRIRRVFNEKLSCRNLAKRKSKFQLSLKFRFKTIINNERKKSAWKFKSKLFFDLMGKYLDEIIWKSFPDLIELLHATDEIIKRRKISIVLISERYGAKRIILSLIARRNGIPVLHIPHSVEPGHKIGDKIVSSILCDTNIFPYYPTHEVSCFKYHKQLQEDRGISKNNLFLTGMPRFKDYKQKSREKYYSARNRLKLPFNKEIVLFVFPAVFRPYYDKLRLNNSYNTFKAWQSYESFLKLFLKRSSAMAVFKLKMLDISDKFINYFVKESEANKVSVFRNNLPDLLTAVDAVVITHSNVGIEALFHDTPVIVYNDPDSPSELPLCTEEAAIEIKHPEELLSVLDKLRDGKNYKKEILEKQRDFLKRNLPPDDLSPKERVSDVIFQLAKNTGTTY